jgi:hypothetical protein
MFKALISSTHVEHGPPSPCASKEQEENERERERERVWPFRADPKAPMKLYVYLTLDEVQSSNKLLYQMGLALYIGTMKLCSP